MLFRLTTGLSGFTRYRRMSLFPGLLDVPMRDGHGTLLKIAALAAGFLLGMQRSTATGGRRAGIVIQRKNETLNFLLLRNGARSSPLPIATRGRLVVGPTPAASPL